MVSDRFSWFLVLVTMVNLQLSGKALHHGITSGTSRVNSTVLSLTFICCLCDISLLKLSSVEIEGKNAMAWSH